MERSMKRAEKLVHATNSALAQMKFSLMFDDGLMGGEKTFRGAEALQPPFCSDGDELKQCQDQFKIEANEMLSKMDKMFGSADVSRKNWKTLDRIKEINRKMNALRQDHPKLRGTEQSGEKLVSLLAEEKLSPLKSSSKGSVRTKPPSPCKRETEPPEKRHRTPKKPRPLPPTQSPVSKSKEDLKSNILETRQIVDRGFHTARHLAQKVENMSRKDRKEKTTSLEREVSETNLRSLDGKSESTETMKSGRHRRPSGRGEKSGDSVEGGQPSNARVVDVKRKECQRSRRWNLRVQRLPSVDIRGGLQLQKVHSLEIPGWGDAGGGKANTGIQILSHERIERAKMEEVLDEVKGEGKCWSKVRGNTPGNCVECSNCGKVIRVQGMRVDPRRVDEILRECRFNVFDPRIDEFVEKYAGTDAWKGCEKSECRGTSAGKTEVGSDAEEKAEAQRSEVQPKAVRGFSLEDLSKQLSTKYRQEAEELESHHLRLNGLLKSLFRKIEESREVFEECHLLRNGKVKCARVLTTTEPVVVSLMGSPVGNRRKQKLDKRDVKNRNKSRTREGELRSSEGTECGRMTVLGRDGRGKRKLERKSKKENEERAMPAWPDEGGTGEGNVSSREAGEGKQRARSPAPTFSNRSWGLNEPEATLRKENTEEASTSSAQDRVRGSRMGSGGKGAKRWEVKEEGKAAWATSAQSSGSSSPEKRGFGAYVIEGDMSPEASLKREERESAQMGMSLSNGGIVPSEVSTERSENNYESDFESLTNEAEEGGGEYEDVESEVVPGDKKLSTISEVDSELEKKLSEEQKTQRGSLRSSGRLDEPKAPDEGVPPNTLHVKGRNSASLTPEVSHETSKAENIPSLKSTPTELVTSLKEILSALKDQFARTETLAEKLTENVRQDKSERAEAPSRSPSEDGLLSPWKVPVEILLENLRSARKESAAAAKPGTARSPTSQYDGMSADSLSDEGGSSLGEIVEGGQKKCDTSFLKLDGSRKSSWLSSGQKEATRTASGLKLNVNSEEVSYSEGEIPSNLMVDSECCSSRSVGEVRQ